MLKSLALTALLLVAALLLFVATRPDHFRVERSTLIQRSPEQVYPLISDFHRWEAWSPWEGIDPEIRRDYSGAVAGAGAVYAWRGNREVGRGRMQIREAQAPSHLVIDIHFLAPFEARNTIEFSLVAEAGGTRVTQAMHGPSPFLARLMSLFFSMEKMVGGKYEEGLANLKRQAER